MFCVDAAIKTLDIPDLCPLIFFLQSYWQTCKQCLTKHHVFIITFANIKTSFKQLTGTAFSDYTLSCLNQLQIFLFYSWSCRQTWLPCMLCVCARHDWDSLNSSPNVEKILRRHWSQWPVRTNNDRSLASGYSNITRVQYTIGSWL